MGDDNRARHIPAQVRRAPPDRDALTTAGPEARSGRPAMPGTWRHRVAASVRFRDRVVLAVATAAGAVAVALLIDWWFRAAHVAQPVLFAALSLAFWYGIARIVLGWVNYLGVARLEAP